MLAVIVIVQDPNDLSALKIVVLDESLLKTELTSTKTFRDINNTRLEFKADARPRRKYLYLHYILTLCRRKRFNVEGWEQDFKKATNGFIWGTPGPWLRRNIIKALAFEVGDAENLEDIFPGEAGLMDFDNQLSREKERDIAVRVRQGIEGLMEEEEDED